VYQVDQFTGADFGAKLSACLSGLSQTQGGTCDARNFTGTLSMGSNLTISTANATVQLPCATISTASQIIVTAGTRNVSLRGCALRGASTASGSQGGTVFLYSGTGAMVQVGDPAYAADTMGFHLDNAVINTTAATSATAQGFLAYRAQELDLESLYLLGNSNQTGMTLDGTGNYTGGTFYDDEFIGFQTAVNAIGHQISNPATTDWLNASTFVRLHIDCPTSGGSPISGSYGINLQQGDGNTITGGDVEGCSTALHLGANAQNNTIVGLRNENSTNQVVADAGSAYNNWMTGGTMFTGALTDNGTRNSFLDTFHRSFNGLNGDWYGSQKDATVTNHFRLGIGAGNERGLLNRYQTDYGYRWTMGLSDATAGAQFYQIQDELNNVYRLSIGQYNNGQSSTNNQTVINSAGTGAVVLNGSNNSGTGGVVIGSGGASDSTVATINNAGNAQFNGTLQVGGTSTFIGTPTVKNQADAEIDATLWAGLTASQKESFIFKDWNGNSQWYMVKDANNNWALNSATGGLDSFKAYQSTNSGDTYINASNASGVVRVNYETGAGTGFNIYGGGSSSLYASFTGTTAIKFPGLASSSGHNCLQIDNSGYITNTGVACGTGSSNGTVNAGTSGQIAYYSGTSTSISGMNSVSIAAGGTGASSASGALANLGGVSITGAAFTGPVSVPSMIAGTVVAGTSILNGSVSQVAGNTWLNLAANQTQSVVSGYGLSNSGLALSGTASSILQRLPTSTMFSCGSFPTLAMLCASNSNVFPRSGTHNNGTGGSQQFVGFTIDGNWVNNGGYSPTNSQIAFDLSVTDISNTLLAFLDATGAQGNVNGGGGIRIGNTDNVATQQGGSTRFLANYIHDQPGDGLDVIGGVHGLAVSNYIAKNNGYLGIDIEESATNRPRDLSITNMVSIQNGASSGQMYGADFVTLTGNVLDCGFGQVNAWNSTYTYNAGDMVFIAGGTNYVSLSNSNLNNTPNPSGTAYWRPQPVCNNAASRIEGSTSITEVGVINNGAAFNPTGSAYDTGWELGDDQLLGNQNFDVSLVGNHAKNHLYDGLTFGTIWALFKTTITNQTIGPGSTVIVPGAMSGSTPHPWSIAVNSWINIDTTGTPESCKVTAVTPGTNFTCTLIYQHGCGSCVLYMTGLPTSSLASGTMYLADVGNDYRYNNGYGIAYRAQGANDDYHVHIGNVIGNSDGTRDMLNALAIPTHAIYGNMGAAGWSSSNPPEHLQQGGILLRGLDYQGNSNQAGDVTAKGLNVYGDGVKIGSDGPINNTSTDLKLTSVNHQVDVTDGVNAQTLVVFNGTTPTIQLHSATGDVSAATFNSVTLSSLAPLTSPTFTGTVTIPSGASISGFAPLASPALTGIPTAPTQAISTNNTDIATTAAVSTAIQYMPSVLYSYYGTTDTVSCPGNTTANFGTSYTIPANTLTAKSMLRVTFGVSATSSSTPPLMGFRLLLGGTTVYSANAGTPQVSISGAQGGITFLLRGTATPSASAAVYTTPIQTPFANSSNVVPFNASTTAVSQNQATNGTLVIQPALFCSANTAGNSITLEQMLVELVPTP